MGNYQDVIIRIWRNISINSIPLIAFSFIMIGIVFYIVKQKLDLKGLVVFLSIIAIACLLYVSIEFITFGLEVKNESYVVYDGTFKYTSVLNHTGNQVNLIDKNNVRLNSLYLGLDDGVYNGQVIYTKWSKWVLYMDGLAK